MSNTPHSFSCIQIFSSFLHTCSIAVLCSNPVAIPLVVSEMTLKSVAIFCSLWLLVSYDSRDQMQIILIQSCISIGCQQLRIHNHLIVTLCPPPLFVVSTCLLFHLGCNFFDVLCFYSACTTVPWPLVKAQESPQSKLIIHNNNN